MTEMVIVLYRRFYNEAVELVSCLTKPNVMKSYQVRVLERERGEKTEIEREEENSLIIVSNETSRSVLLVLACSLFIYLIIFLACCKDETEQKKERGQRKGSVLCIKLIFHHHFYYHLPAYIVMIIHAIVALNLLFPDTLCSLHWPAFPHVHVVTTNTSFSSIPTRHYVFGYHCLFVLLLLLLFLLATNDASTRAPFLPLCCCFSPLSLSLSILLFHLSFRSRSSTKSTIAMCSLLALFVRSFTRG